MRTALALLTLIALTACDGNPSEDPDAGSPAEDGGSTSEEDGGPAGEDGGSGLADAGSTADPDASAPDAGPPVACPTRISLEVDPTSSRLDVGFTGIAHDLLLSSDNVLSLAVDCENAVAPCGSCVLSGPIRNVRKANNRRCATRPWLEAESDADCPSGEAVTFFGAPIPLGSAGTNACTYSRVVAPISGTIDFERGSMTLDRLDVETAVHVQITNDMPCPVCEGDPGAFDGVLQGSCNGGARHGQPCDVSARSSRFGLTSHDCPPSVGTRLSSISLSLGPLVSERTEWEIGPASPICEMPTGEPAVRCHVGVCTGGGVCRGDDDCPSGETCGENSDLRADSCAGACVPRDDDPGIGHCETETVGVCAGTSANCRDDLDCGVNGPCLQQPVSCMPPTVSASGRMDVSVGGLSRPALGSIFAVVPTFHPTLDPVLGLPGPGRLQLELIVSVEGREGE